MLLIPPSPRALLASDSVDRCRFSLSIAAIGAAQSGAQAVDARSSERIVVLVSRTLQMAATPVLRKVSGAVARALRREEAPKHSSKRWSGTSRKGHAGVYLETCTSEHMQVVHKSSMRIYRARTV